MTSSPTRLREALRTFDFETLFIDELGWDRYRGELEVEIEDQRFILCPAAHKRGLVAFVCSPNSKGDIPSGALRRKIERRVAKSIHEHLLVFVDAGHATQVWQWVRREKNKPLVAREHTYSVTGSGDALLQKLKVLAFTLDEEEDATILDATSRTRKGFDVETVTKKFYDRFQKEHSAFLAFIEGIDQDADREWYASVMLNRLMFCYFIQKKGFLDGDTNYLRTRLGMVQAECGQDQFHTFYRQFLLRLFHEGLGGSDHSRELEKLLGRIPYLNGGLFDIHELERPERYGNAIEIPDEAFEHIFDYFDQYQWHLDDRPLRQQNEINPDVLGYIFEKYINQKQMGAYYSKEDITEYISKNTVLPYLFDAARPRCKIAFENPGGPTLWDLLRDDPDRYIYEAVRHGTDQVLPEEIAVGINPPTLHNPVGEGPVATLEARKEWNKAAPPEYALPTEIWREVIARRQRYEEIWTKLSAGEIRDINALITLNLDIRQFAQDVVETCEGPDLLRAFWKSIESVTILDPTCGSGAFLFAALSILEPLYEACLDRMEAFVEDLERSGEKHRPEKYSDFRKILERVNAHPNRKYFVYKSIILNNLYGVDIMDEAVEICKLRLFLKLAAQVEPNMSHENLGIEPLPDIDFNIRAGNTLVGFATMDEVRKALSSKLDLDNTVETVEVAAADLQQAFDAFRQRQIEGDGTVPIGDKQELGTRLTKLGHELSIHLSSTYGVDPMDAPSFQSWLATHRPFHWSVEFYGIIAEGGFDVIIGNPPFVEYSKIKKEYTVHDLVTGSCGNLYAFICERAIALVRSTGRSGLIMPMAAASSRRMEKLRQLMLESSSCVHLSSYAGDAHPSLLFEGVRMRLSIAMCSYGSADSLHRLFTTRFQRWYSAERPVLFERLQYLPADPWPLQTIFPRLGGNHALDVLGNLETSKNLSPLAAQCGSGTGVFYQEAAQYFLKASVRVPFFSKNGKRMSPPHGRVAPCSEEQAPHLMALLSSSLFYFWYHAVSDCYHASKTIIEAFPCARALWQSSDLLAVAAELESSLHKEATRVRIQSKTGDTIEYAAFNYQSAKALLDSIDVILALCYGMTEAQLDYVVHYDGKYRMGQAATGNNNA